VHVVIEERRIAGAQAQAHAVPDIDDGYAVFFENDTLLTIKQQVDLPGRRRR
jgi:hypothetical protein